MHKINTYFVSTVQHYDSLSWDSTHSIYSCLHICINLLLFLYISFYVNTALAERTVLGKITDKNGNPAVNVRVKAFDSDSSSADDYMGESITNSNGNYDIHYTGGHWDSAPHSVTTWRPDIYIKVSTRVTGRCEDGKWDANANWLFLQNSNVTSNQPHKTNLTKNLKLSNYPLPYVGVETFTLKTNMWCKVDFFFHTNCFACSDNQEKIEWSEYGITGVPLVRQRCWTAPTPQCTAADWQKIQEWNRLNP